jgi:hypothetical protein
MKLLVDMNLSPRWIGLLHNTGWEVEHWSAVGKVNAPDSEVMAYAAQHDYVVLTHDLDFKRDPCGNTWRKTKRCPDTDQRCQPAGNRIAGHCGLQASALLTIDRRRTRVRLLPLVAKE